MKHFLVIVSALLFMGCTNEEFIDNSYKYSEDDYRTMYEFIQNIYDSDLFGIEMPVSPSYDEMMQIASKVIMTDVFGDTIGEGDCEKEYRLMLAYFNFVDPNADVTKYLEYIIEHEMY